VGVHQRDRDTVASERERCVVGDPCGAVCEVERRGGAGRQIARAHLVDQNLPGLSVAVGEGSEIVWAEGFGWADLEKKTPVAPETRFRIGTASTPLTSAAAGLLLEQGRLSLDEPIRSTCPSFPRNSGR
jgi:CubicO group peptidase (beta-lactamase class C family)